MTKSEEELSEIKEILTEMRVDLKYHIKRTNQLEDRFKPVEDHVKFIRHLMKVVTWACGVAVAVIAVFKGVK